MKLGLSTRRSREKGGALTLTLLIVMVIGVSLGSYLSLVSSQNYSTMRSMTWASAIPAAEAGVEEALTHLYHNDLGNIASEGWVQKADGWYQKCGNLGGGFGYVTRIQPVNPPVIVSTGIAPTPLGPTAIGTTDGAILGAALSDDKFVQRAIRVDTKRDGSLFVKGMVAKGQIDLNGNNITTDSFDSEDAMFSTGGKYDPLKRKDNGDVATNSGLVNSLAVGNADIMGRVATGPGGSVSIGPNGTVGDKLWVASGRTGIQPGRSSSDMNVSFPEIVPPFTTGMIPSSGTVDGTSYNQILGDGDYVVSSLDGKILVTGNARVYVKSSLSLTGKEGIWLKTGASLQMYVGASSANIAGNGVVNENGYAKNFQYWGLPSNTSVSLGGNGFFAGTLYAPNAHFALNGGGNNTEDFVGASVTATVSMNGHFNFHYDEALARQDNGGRGYLPDNWNELAPDAGLPVSSYAGVALVTY